MSRLRADALVAASVPVLLVAGLLPWQRDEICTVAGCGGVQVTAWNGSPAWALPLLAGIGLGGLWVMLLPSRRVPTGIAVLTAAVAALGTVVIGASLDAVVFGRAGVFHFALPVVEEFPVLSVRPGVGLPLALAGLIAQAVAGWMTVRARGALVAPWRPPRPEARRGRPPAGAAGHARPTGGLWPVDDAVVGLAQGPPPPARRPDRHRQGPPPRSRRRHG